MLNKHKKPRRFLNLRVWNFYSNEKVDLLKNFKQKYGMNKFVFLKAHSGKQDEE